MLFRMCNGNKSSLLLLYQGSHPDTARIAREDATINNPKTLVVSGTSPYSQARLFLYIRIVCDVLEYNAERS